MQANKQEKQTQSQNILEQDPLPSNDKNSEKNDDSKNQMSGMEHSNNAQDNCSYTISIKGEGNIEEDEKENPCENEEKSVKIPLSSEKSSSSSSFDSSSIQESLIEESNSADEERIQKIKKKMEKHKKKYKNLKAQMEKIIGRKRKIKKETSSEYSKK